MVRCFHLLQLKEFPYGMRDSLSVSLLPIDSEKELDDSKCPCTREGNGDLKVAYPLPSERLLKFHVFFNDCNNSIITYNETLSKLNGCSNIIIIVVV